MNLVKSYKIQQVFILGQRPRNLTSIGFFLSPKALHKIAINVSKKYDTAYSKQSEVKLITIGLASPEKIRQWAEKTLPNGKILGQVTNANTLHHKTFKPQKGGLFCERIFGPLKDFQCACGTIVSKPQLPSLIDITKTNIEEVLENEKLFSNNAVDWNANQQNSNRNSSNKLKEPNQSQIQKSTLQGPKAQNSRRFCPKCDVEYTWSVIRRYQLGYIELVSPVTHLWYLKGNPSYLSILLDMKKRHIEYVTYCTESMTLENSIKGINQNRFNKIPSQMLLNWENTVKNFSNSNLTYGSLLKTKKSYLTNEKNIIIGFEAERKKQKRSKTKVQKRLLPLSLQNYVYCEFGNIQKEVNFPNPFLEPIKKINSKNLKTHLLEADKNQLINPTSQKFQILLSLIHKSILDSLVFDSLKVKPRLEQGFNLGNPFLKISIKKLIKKLPPSLYLFLTLQFCLEKEFLIVTKNKLWKKMYSTSLKRSIKNQFFFDGSTFLVNQNLKKIDKLNLLKTKNIKHLHNNYSDDARKEQLNLQNQIDWLPMEHLSMNQSQRLLQGYLKKTHLILDLDIKQCLSYKNQEFLLFIEMVKKKWFLSFLTFVKKLTSENILNLNNKLLTSYELTNEKMIDFLSQEFLIQVQMYCELFPPFPKDRSNFKRNNPQKQKETHLNSPNLNFVSFSRIDYSLNNYTNLSSRVFLISKIQKYNETLLHAFFTFLVKEKTHDFSFPTTANSVTRFGKSISHQDQHQIGLVNQDFNHSEKPKILLTKIKKQYLLLRKLMNSYRSVSYQKLSENRLQIEIPCLFFEHNKGFSGEYLCNKILSPESKAIERTYQNRKTLTLLSNGTRNVSGNHENLTKPHFSIINQSNLKEQNLTNKFPKLVNQIYSLSHRERWVDEEWQNFIDYMSVPFKNWQTSVLLNQFSSRNNVNQASLFQFQQKINSSYEKIKEYSLIPAYKNINPTFLMGVVSPKANRSLIFNRDLLLAKKGGLILNNSSNSFVSNNYAFFSGPGIIQQLLNEFDFAELQKIDKQNRILLYQLNKHIFLLKKRITKLARKELKECYKKRDQLIRRTKLIRTFFRKDSKPNSMILTILPVLPPDLRPIVKIGGQIAASDLNRLYQRVIYRNDRLRKFLKEPATSSSYEMKYAQRLLQEAVDNLIQNGKSGTASEKDARGRALKSLSDLLKGKQGRFRQYLLGKRVDYSGRSVIVVGPKLKLHECGLPKEMALELYFPFLLKRILNHNYARTVVGAKTLMKKNPDLTWELLKEIMQTCPILLNRAPTLHRLGIQAFQPKLIEGRAILLHPLVCPAFNADFDGDQMAVHVPITVEARAEAWKLMCARQNFLSPATGDPLAIPSQDMVLGCYYLTTFSNKFSIKNQKGSSSSFSNFSDVLNAYRRQIIDLHSLVWVKFDGYLEQENQLEPILEIRINTYGNWNEIYQFIQKNYSQNQNLVNQYICTTPGRILFNFIVQKTLFG